MASDDRDQIFEKALARQLRSSPSAGPDGGALQGTPLDLCPDPELLAAYHDGSLSPDELSLWKPHVVTCDHCQLILAHLETPLEIPVLSTATESPAKEKESVVVSQPLESNAGTPSRVRPAPRPSPLHNLRWLWLVPAGAIAASFVAWISLHETKTLPAISSSPVEVAENRQPAPAAPSAKVESAPPANARKETAPLEDALKKERGDWVAPPAGVSPAAAASAERDLAANASQNQPQLNTQSRFQNSLNANHGPSLSQQKQEQQIARIAGAAGGAVDQKKLDAGTQGARAPAAPPAAAARERVVPQPSAAAPSSEPSFVADGSMSAAPKDKAPVAPPPPPAPSLAAPKPTTANANADAISAVTQTVEVTDAAPIATGALAKTNESGAAILRSAALQNPRVFAAPGGKHLWRLGTAGSLEYSADRGVTWNPQISGVYTDLRSASAPSAKICWIVGSAGTILRTTDGGKHWTKLDAPLATDIATVIAADAQHAKISFVSDPPSAPAKSYETQDGGATWFPAAP